MRLLCFLFGHEWYEVDLDYMFRPIPKEEQQCWRCGKPRGEKCVN